jgi:hypothetical protein
MRGAVPSFPQYAFMAWYLFKHRTNLPCLTLPLPLTYVYIYILTGLFLSDFSTEIKCCMHFSPLLCVPRDPSLFLLAEYATESY